MLIIKPYIFERFGEIIFGFSTKTGLKRKAPYYFNLSYSVGDEIKNVSENRNAFFNELGLKEEDIAYQKQVHGNKVTVVEFPGNCGNSDAMITTRLNLGLAISTADCCAIFIYASDRKILAGVHSGWRGTAKRILQKTVNILVDDFNCNPEKFICYLSPSISQHNYIVGKEVAEQFEPKYVLEKGGNLHLNIAQANLDMLLLNGVKKNNIQVSNLCTYEYSEILHSYRREGERSGRALGVIAIRGNGR